MQASRKLAWAIKRLDMLARRATWNSSFCRALCEKHLFTFQVQQDRCATSHTMECAEEIHHNSQVFQSGKDNREF